MGFNMSKSQNLPEREDVEKAVEDGGVYVGGGGMKMVKMAAMG